jgi:hypothetical protein
MADFHESEMFESSILESWPDQILTGIGGKLEGSI